MRNEGLHKLYWVIRVTNILTKGPVEVNELSGWRPMTPLVTA